MGSDTGSSGISRSGSSSAIQRSVVGDESEQKFTIQGGSLKKSDSCQSVFKMGGADTGRFPFLETIVNNTKDYSVIPKVLQWETYLALNHDHKFRVLRAVIDKVPPVKNAVPDVTSFPVEVDYWDYARSSVMLEQCAAFSTSYVKELLSKIANNPSATELLRAFINKAEATEWLGQFVKKTEAIELLEEFINDTNGIKLPRKIINDPRATELLMAFINKTEAAERLGQFVDKTEATELLGKLINNPEVTELLEKVINHTEYLSIAIDVLTCKAYKELPDGCKIQVLAAFGMNEKISLYDKFRGLKSKKLNDHVLLGLKGLDTRILYALDSYKKTGWLGQLRSKIFLIFSDFLSFRESADRMLIRECKGCSSSFKAKVLIKLIENGEIRTQNLENLKTEIEGLDASDMSKVIGAFIDSPRMSWQKKILLEIKKIASKRLKDGHDKQVLLDAFDNKLKTPAILRFFKATFAQYGIAFWGGTNQTATSQA